MEQVRKYELEQYRTGHAPVTLAHGCQRFWALYTDGGRDKAHQAAVHMAQSAE